MNIDAQRASRFMTALTPEVKVGSVEMTNPNWSVTKSLDFTILPC